MKSRLRVISILALSILVISLIGCAKLINKETKEVKVSVISTHYEESYSTTILTYFGNNTYIPMTTTYPEEFNVTVEYEGVQYHFDNQKYYSICIAKHGQDVNATLEIRHYDNGKDFKEITEIK